MKMLGRCMVHGACNESLRHALKLVSSLNVFQCMDRCSWNYSTTWRHGTVADYVTLYASINKC